MLLRNPALFFEASVLDPLLLGVAPRLLLGKLVGHDLRLRRLLLLLEPALAVDRRLFLEALLLDFLLARLASGVDAARLVELSLLLLVFLGRARGFDRGRLAFALRLLALESGDFLLRAFRRFAIRVRDARIEPRRGWVRWMPSVR